MTEQTSERLDHIGSRDHSVTREYRIFGPPGTGKTTELARQVRRAMDRFGPDSVLVTSFSKATAAELAGRDVPLDHKRIGTLHSHCFRALEQPPIAEVCVDDWNHHYPRLALTPAARETKLAGEDVDEELDVLPRPGDHLLQRLNRCRGLLLPSEDWPVAVREFSAKWCQYKSANGLLDFCDLIEVSLHDFAAAPQNPSVIVTDEAQDLTPLLAALVRKWGSSADYFVIAGDDDQLVYGWVGAIPDVLLEPPIPDDHIVFLEQSHRVPRAVHAVAEKLVRQVTRRQEKTYQPRPADGAVRRLSQASFRSPEYLILKTAEEHLRAGKSIMFIGACSYMLRPIVAVLRKHGVPFHNPYRKSNGFWNPLRTRSRRSAANRILALLVARSELRAGRVGWTPSELALWAEWLRGDVLRTEAIEMLKGMPEKHEVDIAVLQAVFTTDTLSGLLTSLEQEPAALLAWWRNHVAAEFRKRIQFPARVVERRGAMTLQRTPQVIVGTIHAVKGGQADVVYLFPDLSRAGDAQYRRSGQSRDSVLRTFYVGATRARETLYICQRATALAVSI
jgi:superfamily I DNA/RNA helicase